MAANAISIGTTRTGDSDPLKIAVESLVAVFKADWGDQWHRQFTGDGDLRMWKRRAYAQLRGIDPAVIVDGYDRAVRERRPYMPSLAQLVESILALDCERKRAAAELEHVNAPRLPRGSGLSGYVEHLAAEAEGDIATCCVAMMREILIRPRASIEAEQAERLSKALVAHEKLVALKPLRPHAYGERRECGRTGCERPGTISNDRNGAGPWYCGEHWARV